MKSENNPFNREALARQYCQQYGIIPDTPEWAAATNAFCVGYSIGQKEAVKERTNEH